MFESITKSLLGSWGSAVLEFVTEYQLIISIAVVAWGITMMVIRRRKKSKTTAENNDREK